MNHAIQFGMSKALYSPIYLMTNFDDETLLNKTALDAQRKEKERLERLERLKQTVDQNDHISQMAALLPNNGNIAPLPIIDATDPDVVCLIGECLEFDSKQKGTSKQEAQKIQPSSSTSINHEIIELSSGEEDLDDVTEVSSFVPYRVPPKLPGIFKNIIFQFRL
uniref:Uncharacterized protein n=1 Tax=Heterorhabditis bacteriophora TaxID=37862 RepID=A0A1I7WMY3_HETBA